MYFFEILKGEGGWGGRGGGGVGGIYSRKIKLSQIFIQNLFEVTRYLMSPMRNRVTSVYRKVKIAHYSL